jgi:transcriptional regulator with XRE-family HTH domain
MTAGRATQCERCGGRRSAFAKDNLCLACTRFHRLPVVQLAFGAPSLQPRSVPPIIDIAEAMKRYRREHQLTQTQLAQRLRFDQGNISRIESRKKKIVDVAELHRLAGLLDVPPEQLGVTSNKDERPIGLPDPARTLTEIRRARHLRVAGHPLQAHHALDNVRATLPLVGEVASRSEAALVTSEWCLADAWALAEILPDQQLSRIVDLMMLACRNGVADDLDAPSAYLLGTLGNHLRIAGQPVRGLNLLLQAAQFDTNPEEVVATAIQLARAAADARRYDEFTVAVRQAKNALERCTLFSGLINQYAVDEVEARGLFQAGQHRAALHIVEHRDRAAGFVANPQWRIIFATTQAQILASDGWHDDSVSLLHDAARAAAAVRLPHELQRILRISRSGMRQTRILEGVWEFTANALVDLTPPSS